MTGAKKRVGELGSLLYHAWAIEAEAEERYLDLAVQMEMHNNPEVAALFRLLAEYEGKHAEEVDGLRPDTPRPPIDPWDMSWMGLEAPESIPHSDIDYLMTPRQALELSLRAEKAARDFFAHLAGQTDDADVREMAESFAAEEEEHIALLETELQKHLADAGAQQDWDPPADQD
jgi:rubrerythrin